MVSAVPKPCSSNSIRPSGHTTTFLESTVPSYSCGGILQVEVSCCRCILAWQLPKALEYLQTRLSAICDLRWRRLTLCFKSGKSTLSSGALRSRSPRYPCRVSLQRQTIRQVKRDFATAPTALLQIGLAQDRLLTAPRAVSRSAATRTARTARRPQLSWELRIRSAKKGLRLSGFQVVLQAESHKSGKGPSLRAEGCREADGSGTWHRGPNIANHAHAALFGKVSGISYAIQATGA